MCYSENKEATARALDWQSFREANKLSQRFLAEIIGISRRTIQCIEAGLVTPHQTTIQKFEELRQKYAAEGKPAGRRKHK
jgi:DNA-binding XRE family transcriptional regulator